MKQNAPVASGSGTVRSPPPRSPTPEQTLCTASRGVLDELNVSIARPMTPTPGPFTQIRSMLEGFPSSPTEESSPAPIPPIIAPIIATLAPPSDGNATNDSLTASSDSASPPAKKTKAKRKAATKKGETGTKKRFAWRYARFYVISASINYPTPHRQMWTAEWIAEKEGNTKAGFDNHLKTVPDPQKKVCGRSPISNLITNFVSVENSRTRTPRSRSSNHTV
jgi:hypothetical protein